MKYNRTKNAMRNMVFNLIMRIYNLAVPFFIRTLFIYIMGVKYMGLNSLFTSVLSLLSLAELGVGSAMVYSMYKPLAEDDNETVCALMRLYKIYYRVIGSVVLVLGLAVTPFLPYIIKDELPADVNLYVLYFLNLASTVVTYWLFAYKNCIIIANQRNDITSKISICISTLTYITQVVVLVVFHNYYLYVIAVLISNIISNIVTAIVADRIFPQFKARGKLAKANVRQINKRVRDLFTAKLATVILYSADTVVISAFLGLTVLTQYQNYYYIMTSVAGFLSIVYGSMTSIIGNSIVSETWEKNYRDFRILLLIISWIAGFCSVCLLCLYQPFMELWMGKDLLLEFGVMVCFCIYFFIWEIDKILNVYKDAAGIWHSDRYRPLIMSLVNVVFNLITVQIFGLYGVILSTVLPMIFIGYTWITRNLCKEVFKPSKFKSVMGKITFYFCITAGCAAITYFICSIIQLPLVLTIIVRAFICVIVPNVLFVLIYRNTQDFQDTLVFVNNKFLRGRLGKVVRLLEKKKD